MIEQLEYIEETHEYLLDGILFPSITEILKVRFGKKYDDVDAKTLKRAGEKGTQLHQVIEQYCKYGRENGLKELYNFKFLQKMYNFKALENEIPVILYQNNKPIACGRLDLVIEREGRLGIADIKRTSVLDKEYVGCQLNAYRLAYEQTYNKNIDFISAIHLREEKRRYIELPLNDAIIYDIYNEWKNKGEKKNDR